MEINPRSRSHDYDPRNDRNIDQTLLPVMSESFRNFVTKSTFRYMNNTFAKLYTEMLIFLTLKILL